ncbi:MAG: hypothetical protein AAGC70_02885 [Pseudomonadota bacterium]
MRIVLSALTWIGAHARGLIAVAPIVALFLTDLSTLLRPALPFLVTLVYATAMMRIDLGAVTREALQPKTLLINLTITFVFMVCMPAVFYLIAQVLRFPPEAQAALVYGAVAPPFGSAAAVCLLLGANAALALQLSVLSALAAPIIGPWVAELLLGEALEIEPLTLGLRIAAMLGAGAVIAILGRRLLRPSRIARHAKAFDGAAAAIMILFVFPLFDGVWDMIAADPWRAAAVLAMVFAANLAVQLIVVFGSTGAVGVETAGALGVCMGNRNVALYLAALPPSPFFTLFVALYQIPMYLTPVVMRTAMQICRDLQTRRTL